MPQLYTVGETACNGVHGANRLASNSLLESLVFAKRAAERIVKEIDMVPVERPEVPLGNYQGKEERDKENRRLIMEEIQRRDGEFYDKWCDHEN